MHYITIQLLSFLLWKETSCGLYDLNLTLDRKTNYGRFERGSYSKLYDNSSNVSIKIMKQLGIIVQERKDYLRDPVGCRVYLAESSITNSGLGMFNGVKINKGDRIGYDESPVAIFDFDANIQKKWIDIKENIIDYVWSSIVNGGNQIENEAYSVLVMIPGIGAAANGYPDMQKHHMQLRNATGYERPNYSDLQAGASNEYNLVRFIADKDIPRGIELFVNYGEGYNQARSTLKNYPLQTDYEEANYLAEKFLDEISSKEKSSPMTWRQKQLIWEEVKKKFVKNVQSVLPVNVTYVENIVNNGSALFSLLPDVIRTPEWLEENGQCMDNIMSRPSKVQYAGMGAFATRYITKNSLVAPLPLIIINKYSLTMYELEYNEDVLKYPNRTNKVFGHQLLLNYCFGHKDSSLVFFPYSSGVQFINHNSQKANAELRWSKNKMHRSEWLNLSLDEISKKKSGLMLDIIATRDIYPGDEIYLDYGNDWQQAWNNHVISSRRIPFARDRHPPHDVRPLKLNEIGTQIIPTVTEQKLQSNEKNPTFCELRGQNLERYTSRGKANLNVFWDPGSPGQEYYKIPCDILERTSLHQFIANVFFPGTFSLVVSEIPRDNIQTTTHINLFNNQAKKGAFRHFITIPDEIVPSQWKDNI